MPVGRGDLRGGDIKKFKCQNPNVKLMTNDLMSKYFLDKFCLLNFGFHLNVEL